MSKRKITAALARKGLEPEDCFYDRTTITPSGYCPGWYVTLTEDSEQALIEAGFDGEFQCDDQAAEDVLRWVESLPSVAVTTKRKALGRT